MADSRVEHAVDQYRPARQLDDPGVDPETGGSRSKEPSYGLLAFLTVGWLLTIVIFVATAI